MNALLWSLSAQAAEEAHAVTHHEVSGWVTFLFFLLLIGLILSLALEERLHAKKSLIAGVFAIVSLLLGGVMGILPFGPITNAFGESVSMPVYIPAVDWSVIAIILGSSLFVDVTSRSGLFTWIALKLTRASSGDPWWLLMYYGLMTVFFSAVLNNVTAMIIVGSLTVVSLERLDQRDKLLGFLLIEALLTNIGGLLTLISSVPNIIIGTTAGISFFDFFIAAAPFVLVATFVTLFIGAWQFGIRRLAYEADRRAALVKVEEFDENDGIESVGFFRLSAAMLVLFILFIATTSALPVLSDLGMGFVALAFGGLILIRYKHDVDEFYRAIDWDLIGFFISLFVVINVMEHARVLAAIGWALQGVIALGDTGGTSVLLVSSAVFSSVTDNIPLAAMLARILDQLGTPSDSALWWSVVFGANLGGNITPIGSASTLVAVTLIHKYGLQLSFSGFVRRAAPYAVIQLLIALGYVLVFLKG